MSRMDFVSVISVDCSSLCRNNLPSDNRFLVEGLTALVKYIIISYWAYYVQAIIISVSRNIAIYLWTTTILNKLKLERFAIRGDFGG